MTRIANRRLRYLFWVIRELGVKYSRFLVVGFLVGLASTIFIGRILSQGSSLLLRTRAERIGIVGEFTPTTLPVDVQKKISGGLTNLEPDGTPASNLALTWNTTESGKRYVFHLREDMKWHNGKRVFAQDVNYNIRGVTFNAIDDKTLEARLSTAHSPFPALLAKPIFQAGLRGFGQYQVAAIRLKGDKVDYLKLVPFQNPVLRPQEYRFYRTEALAILAFKHGDIDTVKDLSSSTALDRWGSVTVTEQTNYYRIVTLFFNQKKNLTKEKTFRQALGFAVETMAGERAYSPISKTSWAYTDRVKKFDTDPKNAKKLLEASNITSGSGVLTLETFPAYLDIAQRIADSWSGLGIQVLVKVVSTISENFDVLLSAQDLPPDPDQYSFWHSTQAQSNVTGYANVKIDKLLEDGRQETDMEKRKAIYADFQRRLTDDAPVLFLFYPKTYTITRGKK